MVHEQSVHEGNVLEAGKNGRAQGPEYDNGGLVLMVQLTGEHQTKCC